MVILRLGPSWASSGLQTRRRLLSKSSLSPTCAPHPLRANHRAATARPRADRSLIQRATAPRSNKKLQVLCSRAVPSGDPRNWHQWRRETAAGAAESEGWGGAGERPRRQTGWRGSLLRNCRGARAQRATAGAAHQERAGDLRRHQFSGIRKQRPAIRTRTSLWPRLVCSRAPTTSSAASRRILERNRKVLRRGPRRIAGGLVLQRNHLLCLPPRAGVRARTWTLAAATKRVSLPVTIRTRLREAKSR